MSKKSSAYKKVEEWQPFDLLFAQHPQPMLIFNQETLAFLDVNQAAIEAYGYNRAEFLAMTIKDIRPSEDVSYLLEFLAQAQSGHFWAGQWRHRLKNGKIIDVNIIYHLIEYDKQAAILVTAQNITEQKRTEAVLQKKEAFNKAILDALAAHIAVLDSVGVIVSVNAAWDKFANDNSPQEGHNIFVGTNYFDVLEQAVIRDNDQIAQTALTGIRAVMSGLQSRFSLEYPCDIPGVKQCWFVMHVATLPDGESGVAIVHEDVTERKEREQQLRYQADLLASVSEAIISTDLNFHIKTWNQAAERLYGWQADEVADKRLSLIVPTKLVGDTRQSSINKLMSEGQWRGEVIQTCKDGTDCHILSTVTLLKDVDGNPSGAVAVNRDITERKQLEHENEALMMQYYQAQKMDSLGRLAGGIAHDFNNLLVPITGYAELGLMELTPEHDLYENFERITKAASRAADLTRQILAFSRQQVLEMQVLNLNEVITGFQHMLRRIIGEDIAIETHLTPEIFPVKADRGQFEQVLLNLAVNARDAMPQGGKLIIETANVVLDDKYTATRPEAEPGSHVMLAVTDTGYGMSFEIQQHIFEPFFTTKELGQGTGLGLATVYGIIKQHQGNIWVYSEVDQGTTFKVYLPAVELPLAITESGSGIGVLHGTETVLVVEDEDSVRDLICDTLAAHGYRVLEAPDPAQALSLSDAHKAEIDLLLTDIIMPIMNGHELSKQLILQRPTLKVLYMSGYTDNVIIHHGIDNKSNAFLQKPFTIHKLLKMVRSVLD